MQTPVCDFAARYAEANLQRLHMPGHKGSGPLGIERLDITEIDGADSLYEASGILRESEENAASLFGCPTFYSTEGSSQCIRAMLHLATMGRTPRVAAGRNAHKTFLSAAALLDLDVLWLTPEQPDSYLSCRLTPEELDRALAGQDVSVVYLTSPDYLGHVTDIRAMAEAAHRHGALLAVDNAHGAYLRFLPQSRHPMDLGADLCCDSAHKTLPVLTGGAYLHVREAFAPQVKNALSLFGSTSPSYLILQSLDAANAYLETYRERLADYLPQAAHLRAALEARGYTLVGEEPLKLTIRTKPYGYEGREFARLLRQQGLVCEFADPDFVVLMLTPEISTQPLERAMLGILRQTAKTEAPPVFTQRQPVLSIRQAALAPSETVPVEESLGRILAAASVGCPPAVPVVVCGERIDRAALDCFRYYGITECTVVEETR